MTLTNGAQKTQSAPYNFPQISGCGFSTDVSTALGNYASNGYAKVSHAYPRFNEAATFAKQRTCLGNDGTLLSNFHAESVTGAADVMIIESWNDASEMT